MTPAQQARRARNRAAKEAAIAREVEHQKELAAREVERQEWAAIAAWQATVPDCFDWYYEATDAHWNELSPSAHQILRALVVPDDVVLGHMTKTAPENAFDWRFGGECDIRRAFPLDVTAEQIVVKMWDLERRGLIRANLDIGWFALPEQEEADHG